MLDPFYWDLNRQKAIQVPLKAKRLFFHYWGKVVTAVRPVAKKLIILLLCSFLGKVSAQKVLHRARHVIREVRHKIDTAKFHLNNHRGHFIIENVGKVNDTLYVLPSFKIESKESEVFWEIIIINTLKDIIKEALKWIVNTWLPPIKKYVTVWKRLRRRRKFLKK